MKDSLLLPVQSNGGTRHSANQGTSRGEVLTEGAPIEASPVLPENKNSTNFLETFNKALQLSDDEMSAQRSGSSSGSTQEQETQSQPNGRTLFFAAANQPMREGPSLVSFSENRPVEQRVDTKTPLALAQFTDSEVEALSFPKDLAQNDISGSDLSTKYAELNNMGDLNSSAPLFRETPINAHVSITDTGDTLPIIGEAAIHILSVDQSQSGAIDTAIKKNETNLPNIHIENTSLPEQIQPEQVQLLNHPPFETIKGQNSTAVSSPASPFSAFSVPASSTESADMVENNVRNSDTLRSLSDTPLERTTEQTGADLQNLASTSQVDIQMTGELWAELEITSPENPDRHIETAEAGNPASLFLPAQTINRGTDLLSLPLIRDPLEDARQSSNIHNFRGVLTQVDVEQIMLGRSNTDQPPPSEPSYQDPALSSEASEVEVDFIKTAADNIIGASTSDIDNVLTNTADNRATPNTGTSRAELDYIKTTADNTASAISLENVRPYADTASQIEDGTDLLSSPLMREPLEDARQPGNIDNFRGALTQDEAEQIMLGRSSTDQNHQSDPLHQDFALSSETSEAEVDYIKTTTGNTAPADSLENVRPQADTALLNGQSEFENADFNTTKAPIDLPPPTVESASFSIAPNDNQLESEVEANTKAEAEAETAKTAQQNTSIENTETDILETASSQSGDVTQEDAAQLPLPKNIQSIDTQPIEPPTIDMAATSDDTLIETVPNSSTLPVGIGAPLTPVDRAVNENNRGTVSLTDFQLGASRQTDLNMSELNQKAAPKETRDIETDIERDDLPSPTDIRDVEVQPDEIDISDLMSEAAETDFETAKNLPSLGQTTFSPLAMSTASSPLLQPLMGLGAETLSPLALQSQNAAASSSTFSQSPALQQAVVSTVSEALLTAKETPKGVVVQLDPPEMGRVYIDFLFEGDNNVSVVVKSESAESQAILRERQEYFQSLLKESGFNNVTLSFEQQTGNGEGSSESGEQGKDINIALSGQSVEAQAEPYNQRIYQMSEDVIRLDMRL